MRFAIRFELFFGERGRCNHENVFRSISRKDHHNALQMIIWSVSVVLCAWPCVKQNTDQSKLCVGHCGYVGVHRRFPLALEIIPSLRRWNLLRELPLESEMPRAASGEAPHLECVKVLLEMCDVLESLRQRWAKGINT